MEYSITTYVLIQKPAASIYLVQWLFSKQKDAGTTYRVRIVTKTLVLIGWRSPHSVHFEEY